MNYKIIIEKKAEKEAQKIPQKYRHAIDKAILSLSSNPRQSGSKKLMEKEGYRISAGDYRILYMIDDDAKIVVIYRIKIKGESTYK
ncbi:MAG: type II toxin-antitoxin system RelE/ParE family toxin [Deltaproteobacteria bacterium]